MPHKVIILDRDGVINRESSAYIKTPEEWVPIPGSLDAIVQLNALGYTIAVATNQSGVARGLYTEATLAAIHQKMHQAVQQVGGHIDTVFYCPHHPDEGCVCRKPRPGMLEAIGEHYQIDLSTVMMVGDRQTDVEVAQSVQATPIFLSKTSHDEASTFPDLATFVKSLS